MVRLFDPFWTEAKFLVYRGSLDEGGQLVVPVL